MSGRYESAFIVGKKAGASAGIGSNVDDSAGQMLKAGSEIVCAR
jgi:hypothetical protein